MKLNKILVNSIVATVLSLNLQAKVTMPAIFTDGMVLQQESKVPIWGSTDKKSKPVYVTTSWDNKKYTVQADAQGKFKLSLETPKFGGPFELTIDDGQKLTLKDVMIGEVWLCSRQSNMDMRMAGRIADPVENTLEASIVAPNQGIRTFNIAITMKGQPQTDCSGSWKHANIETIPDFSAVAYYFARKINEVIGMPVGVILASCGGSRLEAWMSPDGVAPFKEDPTVKYQSALYNGMIAPIAGYGIRGCLWYQGEANTDAAESYAKLFPAMVTDWRNIWRQGDFPFYYAQIAPFNYGDKKNSAYLRDVQRKCLDIIPSSGMVCLMDIGDAHTIHPKEKKQVGERFAYLALGKAYGKKGFPTTGPLYKSMQIEGDKVTLTFDEIGIGMTSFRQHITDFEIAGEDKKFYPAQVRFGKDFLTLIVSSARVPKPVAVRYGFKNYVKGTLFNMAGLPASSFRTDEW